MTAYAQQLREAMEREAEVWERRTPHREEGKLLDVAMLVDEDGERSATGEIRFEALKKTVLDWDVKDIIRSTCIDTEAANTGCEGRLHQAQEVAGQAGARPGLPPSHVGAHVQGHLLHRLRRGPLR